MGILYTFVKNCEMINYIESEIVSLSIHHIGSKVEEEGIRTTSNSFKIIDESLESIMRSYFLDNFKEPEYHNFTYSNGELEMNTIFNLANNIFNDNSCLHEQSVMIAKHLYEVSAHPNIRRGELMVSYINNMLVDEEMVDAIVIVKSESKDIFLQLAEQEEGYEIKSNFGINPKKIDKACIIFNTESEEGYKLCVIDKTNNGKDARYWSDDFLYIKPRPDAYHQTKNQITMTKAFIKERLAPIHDIDKTVEAEILNRSQKFFKINETFEADNYEEQVFQEEQTIKEFNAYKEDYAAERKVTINDEFDISQEAVKKQSRIFKSVLKLDKNFHIYIHGDRKLIQKGTDSEGRKFYQVFYDEEK